MIQLTYPIQPTDHLQGDPLAPLHALLYGDYQCPYSRRAFRHLQAARRRIGDQLAVVYRHFPAPPDIHPHARMASHAAEAAAAQGRFWEMHAHLFRHQKMLHRAALIDYAAEIGLALPPFEFALINHTHQARIEADLQSGWASGVRGAPALFINGQRYLGQPRLADILAAITQISHQKEQRQS